jgi:hypothetical protein
LAKVYRQKVAGLKDALADPATQTEALEILRDLVERVAARHVKEGFEVELGARSPTWFGSLQEARALRRSPIGARSRWLRG